MIISLLTTLTLAQLPDALDHLKSANITPNVGLLLDASCSMGGSGTIPTTCNWFAAGYNSGKTKLNKNQVMRAVLVGCETASDGILDKWAGQVNFSIFDFGRSTSDATLRAPFGSTLSTLETAAMSVPASGSTPMTLALRADGAYFDTVLSDANSKSCRPNFILLLTDGDPNGGGATFNYNCPVSGDPRTTTTVPWDQPWLGARYLNAHQDFLCSVTGNQQVRVYTIGFGAAGSFNPTNLQRIADEGKGQYYYASDVTQLDSALHQIIMAMTARSGLFYSAPAVQVDQLFSDNVAYVAGFKPPAQGAWYGNIKKHCILPAQKSGGLFDTSDKRCLFKADANGRDLYTNPAAVDLWTGTATTSPIVGGAGGLLLNKLAGSGGSLNTPLRPRKIFTWRPGQSGYIAVDPSVLGPDDTFTHGLNHQALINKLHGYTMSAAASGNPVAASAWPLGDPIDAPTRMLRYGDCDTPGHCYVVSGMNDGMLHFFDAANGSETSALVPAELFRPLGVAQELLKKLDQQPDVDATHRYFVDGGISVFHDDDNGDGIIQSTERAYLIFGLGRGGSAYYQIPVQRFSGVLDSTNNPIRVLPTSDSGPFHELRDTWAAPWLGQTQVNSTRYDVAAFATGHLRDLDDSSLSLPHQTTRRPVWDGTVQTLDCSTLAASLGLVSTTCGNYTPSGYADSAVQNVLLGPLNISGAVAYRVRFSRFDLDAGDKLVLQDSQGVTAASYTSSGPSGSVTPWVYDSSISLRFVTDGHSSHNTGFTISAIEYIVMPAGVVEEHNPGVFIVDLARWNGSSPQSFNSAASSGGILVRVARDCSSGGVGICVDAAKNPDLSEMTCPISTEISAYTVGNILTAVYFGDECGQLWKAYAATEAGDDWRARRILKLNSLGALSNQRSPVAASTSFRKVFRRIDLVPSSCPGETVLGVYFGTGNIQRAAATDEPRSAHDVVGVVWDRPNLPSDVGLAQLSDVSAVVSIDAKQVHRAGFEGWYWQLGTGEKMLRDPLVFDGVAYFKTFQPDHVGAECDHTTGLDRIYAVNNCSAAPMVGTSIADRQVWSGHTDVGGGLLLLTPKDSAPLVSAANMAGSEKAALVDNKKSRVPRIFQWRETRTK
ncbi:MAG: hypothetical protein U1E65_08215 [Myxococcota bacterium]